MSQKRLKIIKDLFHHCLENKKMIAGGDRAIIEFLNCVILDINYPIAKTIHICLTTFII